MPKPPAAPPRPTYCTRCGRVMTQTTYIVPGAYDPITGKQAAGISQPMMECGSSGLIHEQWVQDSSGSWALRS